ncbi:MICOS complex subunit MIC60 [Trichoderma ghanense]|uniref:MICOS complex subunit MIC60 n=1 Tax=Trichoderma ghanense TaxID=65468 RepID=A0ABY2GQV9_9HYPO
MLRSSLRSARLLGGKPIAAAAGRQWSVAAARQAPLAKRFYADQKTPPVLPTSETLSSERAPPPPAPELVDTTVTPSEIPPTPPPPPPVSQSAEPPKASPPPPPPKKKKGFFRRLRNFIFTLMVLGAAGFGGGVWYSRVNDTFHDYFTEYVPFGEQAVLYLEELDFKKRFPNARLGGGRRTDPGEKVRIPAQSGASWRVAEKTEPSERRTSASPSVKKPENRPEEPAKPAPQQEAVVAKPAEKVTPPEEAAAVDSKAKATDIKDTPAAKPLKSIDLMALPDAKEPIVRDLVHMLNDLILVINADGASGKYSSTVEKAKDEVLRIGNRLKDLKNEAEKKASEDVRSTVAEFDVAANDLIRRVEGTMAQQEVAWRKEFEEQMKAVRESYDERVKLLLEREKKLNEEKLQNQLLEQAIALKKECLKEVETLVEEERNSRLGKLNDLSAAVSQLEQLTTGWNEIVDTNLKTQQLHVAVEAVRASLEDGQHPRPFIRELVALKEIAADDAVVDAAIASIPPSAYQRGIPTSSQLIDRFRRVASEVRKASLLPEDAGVASHASSWVLSHVMFKKQGLAEGDDVESILTRTQTYLEEGDLDAATREMNGLQGWAKTLSKDWLAEARKVLEVRQALDVIAAEARLQSLRVE